MGDVVFLAHRNDSVNTDFVEFLSCKNCHNKSWLVVYEQEKSSFPRMKCACCGESAGLFGWVNQEDV